MKKDKKKQQKLLPDRLDNSDVDDEGASGNLSTSDEFDKARKHLSKVLPEAMTVNKKQKRRNLEFKDNKNKNMSKNKKKKLKGKKGWKKHKAQMARKMRELDAKDIVQEDNNEMKDFISTCKKNNMLFQPMSDTTKK